MKSRTAAWPLCAAAVIATAALSTIMTAQDAKRAPVFEVDPFWPKPLANHWVTGSTIGLSVDAQDNVWTIHRPNTVEDNFKAADIKTDDARGRDDEALPGAAAAEKQPSRPIGQCCKVAPPVLVDQLGDAGERQEDPGVVGSGARRGEELADSGDVGVEHLVVPPQAVDLGRHLH